MVNIDEELASIMEKFGLSSEVGGVNLDKEDVRDRGGASRFETDVRANSERWVPPGEEGIKINTNAGINLQHNRIGNAAVARDSNGKLVKANVAVLHKQGVVIVKEAIAIRNALIMAKNED
ncbi:hypothetical protein ACH5RR_003430 [Cinchona calisaya]|uniref:Uncharacterized protein n=1 Tax=Cinchona calisaya TaxID=153742 RepID=A0ABD3AUV9_9GENT